MRLQQVFLVLAGVCLLLVAGVASATTVQMNDTQQSGVNGFTGYSMPSGNLIQAGSSTLSSQFDSGPVQAGYGAPDFAELPQMNDGTIALAHPSSNTQIILMDGMDGVSHPTLYQVFSLNLASHPSGYNLGSVDVFASWTGSGPAFAVCE
jgi:hypothetical protein